MRKFVLSQPGSIDNVELVEVASPRPGPGEARVRVRAVALNARDLMIVNGPSPYGDKPGLTLGSDCAGEVVALGDGGIEGIRIGDRVTVSFRTDWLGGNLGDGMQASDLGGGRHGVLAEEVCVPTAALVRIPGELPFESAATLPCAGVTAWRALTGGAGLRPDHVVLVTGTGGVSVLALQIAHAMGCRVIATTRSPEKVKALEALGAAAVIISTAPGWPADVVRLSDGHGFDRAVDCIGPGQIERLIAAARPGAELALVGVQDDPGALLAPISLIGRMLTLRGISVGSRADLEALVQYCSAHFTPAIDSRYPFEEVPAALRRLASGAHVGKIVVTFP